MPRFVLKWIMSNRHDWIDTDIVRLLFVIIIALIQCVPGCIIIYLTGTGEIKHGVINSEKR